MNSSLPRRDRLNAELRVLSAFCSEPSAPSKRFLIRLHNYVWAEPDHEVVYRAICATAESSHRVTQEILSVFAIRAGFPDLDLVEYFAPAESATSDLATAIEVLLAEAH